MGKPDVVAIVKTDVVAVVKADGTVGKANGVYWLWEFDESSRDGPTNQRIAGRPDKLSYRDASVLMKKWPERISKILGDPKGGEKQFETHNGM